LRVFWCDLMCIKWKRSSVERQDTCFTGRSLADDDARNDASFAATAESRIAARALHGRAVVSSSTSVRHSHVVIAVAAIAAALAWLYAGVVAGLVTQWRTDDNYTHGFLVAPLAAYFVYERRQALARASAEPSLIGLALIAAGLLSFVAGQLSAELFLTRVSIIVVLGGIVLFVLGGRQLRLLAFPLAFLLLMVPLPAILFNYISFPLQTLAAQLGAAAISAGGVPVMREGNLLLLPGRTLEVAEACSGIRSLVSLLMFAIVFAYFSERSALRRVLIALAAVPIAVLVNAARVGGTGLTTYWISPAAADGFFHSFSGWLMFLMAIGALIACQRLLEAAYVLRLRTGDVPC
jgi:exosortase